MKKNKKDTYKCYVCGAVLPCEDYVIHSDWVQCPRCKEPLFDITIQEDNHWAKTHKLKKLGYVEGMLLGYI